MNNDINFIEYQIKATTTTINHWTWLDNNLSTISFKCSRAYEMNSNSKNLENPIKRGICLYTSELTPASVLILFRTNSTDSVVNVNAYAMKIFCMMSGGKCLFCSRVIPYHAKSHKWPAASLFIFWDRSTDVLCLRLNYFCYIFLQMFLFHPLNHIHVHQVSHQLICSNTCQFWKRYFIGKPGFHNSTYRKISDIRRTKSHNLDASRLIL